MTKLSSAARPIITAVLGCAASLTLGVFHIARADPVLSVTNGEFTSYAGPGTPGAGSDDYFSNPFVGVNPTNWSGGTGLIFVTNNVGLNSNGYLAVYGPYPNQPLPGNFVEADGNPSFESSFSYQLSGLTKGTTYQLSFYQAFGQQQGFTGATTNQWFVGLGTPGSYFSGANQPAPNYSDPQGSVTFTPSVSLPSASPMSSWQPVTVYLTADASNDVLTFLAWANGGSTINVPPIAFLDIGNNGSPVPEPSVRASIVILSLLGGFGFGITWWRKRKAA